MCFNLFLGLIFIRPFIPSLTYPGLDSCYSLALIAVCLVLIKSKPEAVKGFSSQRAVFLFFLSLILAACLSGQPYKSLPTLPKFISYLFVFLVTYYATTSEKKKMLVTLIVTAVCVSLFAIHQFYFGPQHLLAYMQRQNVNYPFAREFLGRGRAFMPFVLPSMLAGYLVLMLPLGVGYLLRRDKRLLLLLLPLIFALLLTKSIGSTLSIFLALFIFIILSGLINEKTALVLFILQLAMMSLFILRGFHTELADSSAYSIHNRLIFWQNTVSVILKHPFRGTGLGNLPFIQSKFSHNSYLQIWAEAGILGIVSFLWLLLNSFKALKPKRLITDKLYAGLVIAHLAFLIHNLIDFSFFLPEVSIFWWITLALFSKKSLGDNF